MLMAPCGPRLTHVPTGSGCHCITHAHTHMHAHLHFSCFYPRLHNSFFYDSPPLIKPHMLSICFGVSASLSIILWPLLILLRVCLASFFFPSVSLSLLSVSLPHSRHTQQTHHHPFNFWPPHNVVPHKKHASITTTVLTHTTHTQTDTEQIPLSPKQHARKYSWESLKSYKANMCGECQALNLGSAVICRDVTTLIFLILSSHLNLFFSVFFIVFVSNSSL